MHSSRMRIVCSSSRPGGGLHQAPPPLLWWPSGVVAFWCGGLLVWWPSVMAFWPPEDHTRRPPSTEGTKPEGHNRRPHLTPGTRHPLRRRTHLKGGEPLQEETPCCKACWNTTCNACWDTTPPVDRHTPAKTQPLQTTFAGSKKFK